MAPRKTQKKSDDAGERSNPNSNVIADTTPHDVDLVWSLMHIFEILEHDIRNCLDDIGNKRNEDKIRDIAEVELHKIAT